MSIYKEYYRIGLSVVLGGKLRKQSGRLAREVPVRWNN